MNKRPICVVFDLDDTLYMERDYARSGFRAVGQWCAEYLEVAGVQEMAQRLFDRGRRGNIFDEALEQLGVKGDSTTISAMVKVYREHTPQINLLPDAIECLARLRNRVYLGLLTDGNPASQWAKIKALELRRRFDTIIVTGDWGSEFFKPHPKGYRYMESRAEVCKGRFVYVADNPSKDFNAPMELGWKAIRVRRPASLHEDQECAPEITHVEVGDLEPVPDLIFDLYEKKL